MDSNQVKWALFLMPMLTVYALIEVRRGWRVINNQEKSPSPNQRMLIWLIRLLKGDESADKAYTYSIRKSGDIRFYAWSSFIGGIVTLALCIIWAIMIVRM
jgi:hypothetical protein